MVELQMLNTPPEVHLSCLFNIIKNFGLSIRSIKENKRRS